MLVLVDQNTRDFGGGQGPDNELRRVLRPEHDIDALPGQLLRHRLHPRAAHADAGPDGIDAPVPGMHGDLRANARVARGRLDLEQPLLDLRDFQAEQLDDELGRGARQHQLRPAHVAVDAHHVGAHAVAHPEVFLGDHLVARQHGLDPPDLEDRVAALDALDRAVDELLSAGEEIVQQLLALGVADPLQDDLLRRLRADAPEVDRLQGLLDVVLELDVRVLLLRLGERHLLRGVFHGLVGDDLPAAKRFEIARIAVDRDADIDVLGKTLLRRRGDRHFQGAEHDFLVDVLFPRKRVGLEQQFAAHVTLRRHSLGTR